MDAAKNDPNAIEWPPEILVGHEHEDFDPHLKVRWEYPPPKGLKLVDESGCLDMTRDFTPWYARVFKAPNWSGEFLDSRWGSYELKPQDSRSLWIAIWAFRIPVIPFALIFLLIDRLLRVAHLWPPLQIGLRASTPLDKARHCCVELSVRNSRMEISPDGKIYIGKDRELYPQTQFHTAARAAFERHMQQRLRQYKPSSEFRFADPKRGAWRVSFIANDHGSFVWEAQPIPNGHVSTHGV